MKTDSAHGGHFECYGDVSPAIHKLAFPTYNSCMARIWKEALDSVKQGGLFSPLPVGETALHVFSAALRVDWISCEEERADHLIGYLESVRL